MTYSNSLPIPESDTMFVLFVVVLISSSMSHFMFTERKGNLESVHDVRITSVRYPPVNQVSGILHLKLLHVTEVN